MAPIVTKKSSKPSDRHHYLKKISTGERMRGICLLYLNIEPVCRGCFNLCLGNDLGGWMRPVRRVTCNVCPTRISTAFM